MALKDNNLRKKINLFALSIYEILLKEEFPI